MGVSYADCTEKEDLVARYKSAMTRFAQSAKAPAPPKTHSSTPSEPPSAKASRAPPPPKQLSIDQMGKNPDGSDGGEPGAEIRRICTCKDFYEILKVERSCDGEALKKAYRKLAIKLHPDKCQLTGAEDAFKRVSNAFGCLNDAKQRAGYDIHGEEVCKPGGAGFGGGFRGDVDAEELFRAFCGSGGGGAKLENIMAAIKRNPWVLLAALTVISNVIYLLEIVLKLWPYVLALSVFGWVMCPPHVQRQIKTQLPAMLMRLLAAA